MADYAIGDVQGCYDQLMNLLDHIQFNERTDRLWFVGDLVNRGPKSLAVVRFVKSLPLTPRITLGNHDFHLLGRLFVDNQRQSPDDTLHELLEAPDAEEIGCWLRHQSILYHDETLNVVMSHAGIAPMWSLKEAKTHARELEDVLRGNGFRNFLANMYGNMPNYWSDELRGMDRLRSICNYFTRMRFCDIQGRLAFGYKGTLENSPPGLLPWYEVPGRIEIPADIVFGHWAALSGKSHASRIYAIDTGCFWGGQLTALRLQDKKHFAVPGVVH